MLHYIDHRPVKYLFYFSNESGYAIYEVKFLDASDDTPKAEKYQWYWSSPPNNIIKLNFISMSNGVRIFEQGQLTFDSSHANFADQHLLAQI